MHAIYPVLDLSGCLMSCLERTSKHMDRNRTSVLMCLGEEAAGPPYDISHLAKVLCGTW
jgi:hypothetical protein